MTDRHDASQSETFDILSLEPRILLDAAGFATGAELAADAAIAEAPVSELILDPQDTRLSADEAAAILDALAEDTRDADVFSTGAMEDKDAAARETADAGALYVIDTAIAGHENLLASVPAGADVLLVGEGEDGLELLSQRLAERGETNAVHILSHGEAGELRLGSVTLTADSIAGEHRDALAAIGGQIAAGGDILLYGCDFGADADALARLADVTGADIAASTDDTGASALGGDWTLEATHGTIDTRAFAAPAFEGVLTGAAPIIDFNGEEAGVDADARVQPTTGNVFPIFPASLDLVTATGAVDSVSFTLSGVVDVGSELLYHSGPAGNTIFWLDGGSQTSTVSLDAGGTVQLVVTRTGTSFTITGVGGAPVPEANIEAFLSQLLYGDLASAFTEGVRDIAFTVTESGTAGDISTLSVRVHNFPIAGDDAGTIGADATAAATGNLLDNDTDATPGDTLSISDVDGYASRVGQAYPTTYGTITVNADGTYAYVVDTSNPTVSGLRDGATIEDVIAYQVTDSDGNVDTAFLVMTITGVDDLPVATDNSGNVVPVEQPTTTGNVIFDDDGAGSDTGDRPLSQLVWETEFTNGESVDGARVTVNGVDVDITSSDPAGVAGASNHIVSHGLNGGHEGYLVFTMGGTADPDNTAHSLTLDFSEPVTNLSFTLADLDWSQGTSWQDQFTVMGYLNGELVPLDVQVAGTVENPEPGVFYGTGSVPATEAHGNVSIRFATPVDTVVILYNYGPDATARDGSQVGALSDLAWQGTGVPRVFAVNGAEGDVGKEVDGLYGTFTINEDGSYTYALDETNPAVSGLLPGATLTDSIPYTLIDSLDDTGNTDVATLTVTITGPADHDLDGVPDSVDLDDDNDGVSDVMEGAATHRLLEAEVVTNSATHPDDDAALFDADPDTGGHLHPGDFVEYRTAATVNVGDSLAFQGGAGAFDIYVRESDTDPWVLLGSNVDVPSTLPVTTAFNYIRIEANYGDHVEFSGVIVQYPEMTTRDTDGDGVFDHLDLDSDNDGISDLEESGSGGLDADDDGVLDAMSDPANDADRDGLLDAFDNGAEVTPRLSDRDDLPDMRDLDSDGDGIPDAVEARPTSAGNTIPAGAVDSDGDGVLDVFDTLSGFGGSFATPVDTDATVGTSPDGVPDYLDGDSDGDGIPDAEESGLSGLPASVTAADPDGTLVPATDLSNFVGDTSEVAYRELNTPPTLDLSDGGADATLDHADDHIPGGTATPLMADGGGVSDPDSSHVTAIRVDVDASSLRDGADEWLVIGGTSIALDPSLYMADADTDIAISIGGNAYTVRIRPDSVSGELAVSILELSSQNDGDGLIPLSDAQAILAGLGYRNTADVPTLGARNFAVIVDADQPTAVPVAAATATITVVDLPPVVDLNGSGAGLDTSATYAEGDGTVDVLGAGAGVADVGNNVVELTVALSGFADGSAESFSLGGVVFSPGTNASDTSLSVGGVPVTLSFSGGTLSITATDGTSALDRDALGALLRTLAYGHASDDPTEGARTFTVSARDAQGNLTASPAVAAVTVSAVNDAPTATDNAATLGEDATGPATGNLITDDSGAGADGDVEGDALSVIAVDGATLATVPGAYGTLTWTSDGGYSYALDSSLPAVQALGAGDVLTDSFTYTVSDGAGGTDSAVLSITIAGANDAPVAGDDAASVTEDGSVAVDVRGNDGDAEGALLTVTGVTQGANGSVAIDPVSGNPVYTPAADFHGTDSFTYTVSDGAGGTATATVTITVDPFNDAPTADDDTAVTNEDTAVRVPVLLNDRDVDGDALAVIAVTQGTNGSVAIDPATGELVYTPDADFHGTDSFTYTVGDGAGGTATATVTVTVDPVNDAPDAGDDAATTAEDTPVTVPVLGNDGDRDGDAVSISSFGQGANGTVAADPATGGLVYTPNADFHGTDSFTYVVSDGAGGEAMATVTVTVEPRNDAPIAGDDSAATSEDVAVRIPVLGNDADVDGDTLELVSAGGAAFGSVGIDPVTGELVYTPDADAHGIDSFTYTVSDGAGGTATATVTVTVSPLNDAPVAVGAIADLAGADGDVVTPVDAGAAFGDVDGDTLEFSATGLPPGLSIDPATGLITGSLDAGASQGGSYAVVVEARDPSGATAQTSFAWVVSNPAPTAGDDATSVAEDASVEIAVLGNDADPDGDALTVVAVSQGANGAVAIDPVSGLPVYTPNADFHGTDSFTYTVSDGQGGEATARVNVSVLPVNDAPVAANDAATTAEDAPVTVDVRRNDGDVDGDGLAVTNVTQGANGTVSLDPVSGDPVYTPDPDFHGTDSFTYTVEDASGVQATASVVVTVSPVNDAPVAGAAADLAAADGDAVTVDLGSAFADTDGDALLYSATGLPDGLSIDPHTGVVSGTVDASASLGSPYTVEVTATDPSGAFATARFVWSVGNPSPVVLSPLGDRSAADGDSVAWLPDIADPDSDALRYSASGLPNGLSIDPVTGAITGTLTADASQAGPYRVTVVADDGEGGVAVDVFEVSVANPAPVAGEDAVVVAEDGAALVDVLANDVDTDGDALEVTSVGAASHGTVEIDPATGGLLYTPDPDFHGTDSFTYTVSDGEGGEAEAIVTVEVEPRNDAPVAGEALPDTAGTDGAAFGPIDVAAVFTDRDGDTLGFSSPDLPVWMTLDPLTGALAGTPPSDASQLGEVSVTVVATDPSGASAHTTLVFRFANLAPEAATDSQTVAQGDSLAGNVIANDSDRDGDALSVVAVGGDAGHVGTAVAGSEGGTFTVGPDGTYSFEPGGAFDHLDSGESVTTSVSYLVSDGEGGTSEAWLHVTVEGRNDAPRVVGTLPVQAAQDGADIAPVEAAGLFADVDGETLTYALEGAPDWMHIDPATGVVSGTAPADASRAGAFTVTVVATDPDGESARAEVAFDVANTPVTAADALFAGEEDRALSGNVLDGDRDADGDALRVDALALPDGRVLAVGEAHDLPEGELRVNADGSFTFAPAPDWNGSFTFGYTVTDGEGSTDAASVTLEIAPRPDAPRVASVADAGLDTELGSAPADAPVVSLDAEDGGNVDGVDASALFAEVDGQELSYALSGAPDWVSIDPVTGVVTGEPPRDASQGGTDGVYVFEVVATDADGQSARVSVEIAVDNAPPEAVADTTVATQEDVEVVIDPLANDRDADGDTLVVSHIEGEPIAPGGAVEVDGGTVRMRADGTLVFAPEPDTNGAVSFAYTVSDGDGGSSTADVELWVEPVNDAPVPTGDASGPALPDLASVEGDAVEAVDLSGGFADTDDSELTYSAQGLPPGLSVDPATGRVTGTLDPDAAADGPYTVTVTATDPDGASATTTFVWEIGNLAPTVTGGAPEPLTVVAGTPVTVATSPFVTDTGAYSFRGENLPEGVSVDPATGAVSGAPLVARAEPYVFDVVVLDARGGETRIPVTLRVIDPPFVEPLEPARPVTEASDTAWRHGLGVERIDLPRWFHASLGESVQRWGSADAFYRGGTIVVATPGLDCGRLQVETVTLGRAIALSASLVEGTCEAEVVDVRAADRRDLERLPDGTLVVHRLEGRDLRELDLRIGLSDGRDIALRVGVDTLSGRLAKAGAADVTRAGFAAQREAALREAVDPVLAALE